MKYLALFLLIILTGCSSTDEVNDIKTYSEDTNRAFLEIERGKSYYSKKTKSQTPAPQIRALHKESPRDASKYRILDQRSSKNAMTPKQTTLEAAPIENEIEIPRLTGSAQDRLIEINQNLAFYCMKHRKSKTFSGDEKKCMSYVSATLEKCQKSHKKIDSKLLGCLNKILMRKP
jgi:hypothetical protein